MAEKVGFIGLGIMGRPMAKNLAKAGFDLVLHNRTREKAEVLAGEIDANVAGSPREVAQACRTVVTMLPDSPDVEAVVAAEGGLLEGVGEGSLLVDMSTISPAVTRELGGQLAERGASMLDAPVSGGEAGAVNGALSIMVGGEAADFERATPLFDAVGKTVTHVGPPGTGQVVKACNQIVVALTYEAVSEALVLGSKAGVDPAKVLDVLSGGLAANKIMEMKRDNFLDHEFAPGFRIELHHKDLGIALAAGREYGVPLPVTASVDAMLEALRARGWGGMDHSAILTHLEDLAEHEIGAGRSAG